MSGRDSQLGPIALNTNTAGAVTGTVFEPLSGASYKSIYVVPDAAAGTNSIHQVQIQGSPDDGTTWFDMWEPITGKGMIMHKACACQFIRAKTIVPEGSPSGVKIYFFATD